ncbi:DUF6933 domain-containing protein [Gillisia sp. CAL575]|uniref:DUF6933 domain-containing protein n=1 Tax=Gillisia sp. CAL575 TaxID=985255 RepID=UPI000550DC23|nr:hypothetical protein [Gillisia sp. CAL575]
METQIYTTRKLEKLVHKYLSEENSNENNYLGKWSANIFYVNHKKCWILINKLTKYILVLSDIKQGDLNDISKIFTETFYSQLIYDGIIVEYDFIEKIVGKVELHKTDNDRSANGSLNNCLLYFDDWKHQYVNFENMPFRDLNGRLNSSPNKMLNWKYPKEAMDKLLSAYA